MSTIPASAIVNVLPNVISPGGSAIAMNGLILDNSNRVPNGSVLSFPSAAAVSAYFGAGSVMASAAAVYFNGYAGATVLPSALLVTNYPQNAVSAFERGGNVSGFTLTQLQALAGSLNLTVDGYGRNVANISLAGALSFSNAATIIQSALNGSAPNVAVFNGSINNGTMTVTSIVSGTIVNGLAVTGTAVNSPTPVVILGQLSGSVGGTGTYQVSGTVVALSGTLNGGACPIIVTFDSVSGAFLFTSGLTGSISTIAFATGVLATSLLLASNSGGVISQGAGAAVPGTFMASIINQTQNWGLFALSFAPDAVVGVNTNKLLFAQWVSSTNNRYAYVAMDHDPAPQIAAPAPTSFAQQVIAAAYSGVISLWEPTGIVSYLPFFTLGMAASINFNALNGRITFAGKGQAGIPATVTDPTTAANLIANGYNFYGAYATATTTFLNFQNGQISGPFLWADSYINQIWMNANFQQVLMVLLTTANSIPYNSSGYAAIENTLISPINAALNFGSIRVGVNISSSEIQQINNQAGNQTAANTVQNQGWYLQVIDPGSNVRIARGSPICNLWYADGQSVQKITLNSVDVL